MTAHQHAEEIGMFAEDAQETNKPGLRWQFRGKSEDGSLWMSCNPDGPEWLPEHEYRRKPQTITVNGVEVPKPLTELPESDAVWVARVDLNARSFCTHCDSEFARVALYHGIAHSTEEAAIAHAEAMLLRDVDSNAPEAP